MFKAVAAPGFTIWGAKPERRDRNAEGVERGGEWARGSPSSAD